MSQQQYVEPGFAGEQVEELVVHEWVQILIAGGYVSALWFAWWCRHTGGWPSISFGWRGFQVNCYR